MCICVCVCARLHPLQASAARGVQGCHLRESGLGWVECRISAATFFLPSPAPKKASLTGMCEMEKARSCDLRGGLFTSRRFSSCKAAGDQRSSKVCLEARGVSLRRCLRGCHGYMRAGTCIVCPSVAHTQRESERDATLCMCERER